MGISYKQAVSEIIEAGQWLDSKGFCPATAGNYSIRLGADDMAVTVSGVHKGYLTAEQIMRTDFSGKPMENKKSSAETLLHCGLYKLLPQMGAVLHTHSVPCTVLTREIKADHIILEGYELLKIFPGIQTHDVKIRIPIFENSQDMVSLQAQVDAVFKKYPQTPAYLLRGHGLYAWAEDMTKTRHVVEALEFLLSCELETLKLRRT
jgi:methylthioribulose-1-phosphate dehydratase